MDKNETKLFELLKKGDKRTFERFYQSTYTKLYRFIFSRVGIKTDSEELTHDTYLSFLDSLPLFQAKSTLSTFLYSIARHEIADYFRKKYAKKALLTVPYMDHLYTEKLYTAAVLDSQIEQVFRKISYNYRVILRLRYEHDMTVTSIARQLKLTGKAAESRLFRARSAFRQAYFMTYGN